MNWIFYILAICCGVTMATQSGVNSELRKTIGNPIMAAVISFAVGLLSLLVVIPFFKEPIPSFSTLKTVEWYKWTGGLLGAFFVIVNILAVQKIGSANMIVLIICGQIFTSIILDHFGLLGFKEHSINIWRLAGGLLIVGGVYLILRN